MLIISMPLFLNIYYIYWKLIGITVAIRLYNLSVLLQVSAIPPVFFLFPLLSFCNLIQR